MMWPMVRIHHGTPFFYNKHPKWPHRLAVRIHGFHPCYRSSSLRGVTTFYFKKSTLYLEHNNIAITCSITILTFYIELKELYSSFKLWVCFYPTLINIHTFNLSIITCSKEYYFIDSEQYNKRNTKRKYSNNCDTFKLSHK